MHPYVFLVSPQRKGKKKSPDGDILARRMCVGCERGS
jgi:hypothetical protein